MFLTVVDFVVSALSLVSALFFVSLVIVISVVAVVVIYGFRLKLFKGKVTILFFFPTPSNLFKCKHNISPVLSIDICFVPSCL